MNFDMNKYRKWPPKKGLKKKKMLVHEMVAKFSVPHWVGDDKSVSLFIFVSTTTKYTARDPRAVCPTRDRFYTFENLRALYIRKIDSLKTNPR